MTTLDARSQQQIIELLSPLMASEQDRRSLLILAFVNHPLVQQIDFSGTVASFVPALVDRLAQFGKLNDGRPALWMLLDAMLLAGDYEVEIGSRNDAMDSAIILVESETPITLI